MRAYLDFILYHPNQSDLTTDIFCVNAQEQEGLALLNDVFNKNWNDSTRGNVATYQAKGNHFEVLAEPHIAHNAKIIQSVLEKL